MQSCNIAGIRFDNFSMTDLIVRVQHAITHQSSEVIAFSNPEFVIESRGNDFLHMYLNNYATVNVADGVGVVWAAKLLGTPLKERVTGTDFVRDMIKLSVEQDYRVYFLGGKPGVAKQAKSFLAKIHGKDVVVGCRDGYFSEADSAKIVEEINVCAPHIVMVCLGNPKQEAWIFKHRSKLKANVVFGNGGALDFWSGSAKRAPDVIRRIGLEWLFRLGQDFTYVRIRRQLKLFRFVAMVGVQSFQGR